MASKYQVIVEAIIDQAQLQDQIKKVSASKQIKVQAKVELNPQALDNQIKRWQNALDKLQSKTPAAFANPAVQQQVDTFNQLIAAYRAGGVPIDNVRTQLDNVRTSLTQVSSAMRGNTKDGMDLAQMFELAAKKVMIWFGATTLVYGSLRQMKEGVQYIRDLDKELTNTAIVMNLTSTQVGALAQQYNVLAVATGSTTLQIARGALEWQRAGKSAAETTQLLKASTMMAKLGNLEAAEATQLLTSTLNGFKIESEDAIDVVSKLIAVDNAFSTSTGEVATALQYSAAVANQAGVTFDELVAYITTISSVMRISAESVGQSLKTLFTRFEQVKIGQLFEDDPTTINQVAESLHAVGIEMMKDANTFRPLGDVLEELAAKWDTLNQKQQSAIANTIAGKTNARTHSNMRIFAF